MPLPVVMQNRPLLWRPARMPFRNSITAVFTQFSDELTFRPVLLKGTQGKGSNATGHILFDDILKIKHANLAKRFANELLGSHYQTGTCPSLLTKAKM